MTNFERKKKNGALDALRGHRTRILAGIFADIGSYTGGCLYKLRTLGARFTSSGELRGASALLARTAAKILSTQMAEQDIFTFERINVYVKEANCGAAVTCSR